MGLARRLDSAGSPAVTAGYRDRSDLLTKGAPQRAEVMRGVFQSRPSRQLVGRTVLLVDDVLTTGATCGDAARALKKAGAARVVVIVIARTERKTL